MAEIKNLLQEKLESSWNRKDVVDNFVEDKELTVTITLSEYRKLVMSDAIRTNEIEKANSDKYEREAENRKLNERVKELKGILLKYRAEFGELEEEESEE